VRLRGILGTFSTLLVGHTLGKLLGVVSSSIVGRALGPSSLGVLGAALTGVSYLVVISNFGQDATAISLVAVRPELSRPLRRSVLRIRLVVAAVIVSLSLVVAITQRWSLALVAPLLASVLVYGLRADWLLLGIGRPKAVAVSSIIRELAYLLLVAGIVARWRTVVSAAVCYLLAELVWAGATQIFLRRLHPQRAEDRLPTSELLAAGWPIGVMGLMSLTYNKIDTPLLAALRGTNEAGLYWAAYTIMFAVMGVAAVLSRSALPEMARTHSSSHELTPTGIHLLVLWTALCGGAAAVTLSGSAGLAMRALYGPEFDPAVPALRLLSLSLPLNFASGILLNYLVASGRRGPLAIGALLAAVANVGLNLWLIPHEGMRGAAIATLASESVLLATGIVGAGVSLWGRMLIPSLFWIVTVTASVAMFLPRFAALPSLPLSLIALIVYAAMASPLLILHRGVSRRGGKHRA